MELIIDNEHIVAILYMVLQEFHVARTAFGKTAIVHIEDRLAALAIGFAIFVERESALDERRVEAIGTDEVVGNRIHRARRTQYAVGQTYNKSTHAARLSVGIERCARHRCRTTVRVQKLIVGGGKRNLAEHARTIQRRMQGMDGAHGRDTQKSVVARVHRIDIVATTAERSKNKCDNGGHRTHYYI